MHFSFVTHLPRSIGELFAEVHCLDFIQRILVQAVPSRRDSDRHPAAWRSDRRVCARSGPSSFPTMARYQSAHRDRDHRDGWNC